MSSQRQSFRERLSFQRAPVFSESAWLMCVGWGGGGSGGLLMLKLHLHRTG